MVVARSNRPQTHHFQAPTRDTGAALIPGATFPATRRLHRSQFWPVAARGESLPLLLWRRGPGRGGPRKPRSGGPIRAKPRVVAETHAVGGSNHGLFSPALSSKGGEGVPPKTH